MLNRDELAFQLFRDMRRDNVSGQPEKDARSAYTEADAFLAEKAAQDQPPAVDAETSMPFVKVPCDACQGLGIKSVGADIRGGHLLLDCSQCHGTGQVLAIKQEG